MSLGFTDKLLSWSIGLSVALVASGIACGHATGNPPFSLSWHISTWRLIVQSFEIGGTDRGENPPSIFEVGQGAKDSLAEKVEESGEGITDPRLIACPSGSVSPEPKVIPLESANILKRSANERTWEELKTALGEPACKYSEAGLTKWHYLVTGGRIILAEGRGGQPKAILRFINW